MAKGYQLLLLGSLDSLAKHRAKHRHLFLILNWVAVQIGVLLKERGDRAEIEVIMCEYMGAYPGLGIHYFGDPVPLDLGPFIEAEVERILRESPVIDFVNFIAGSGIDWDEAYSNFCGTQAMVEKDAHDRP